MGRLRTALCLIPLLTSACAYRESTTVVPLSDPGKCVPVDIAAAPETASLLADTASHFNGSSSARMRDGGCAFVRVQTVDASVAMRELVGNWPDSKRLGPAPVAWVPGSTMWGQLLNVRLADQHRRPMAPNGTPFARTPLVIAMPAPMARALDYPHRQLGWSDLAQLARNERGWGAYGHHEWGPFRLGKGNPSWSTTGLDATIALAASSSAVGDARALEQSVVYYGDSTQVYFDNWQRLAKRSTSSALTYLSAVIADERSVVAYNTGHAQDDVSLGGRGSRPALPLVAIYPKDAGIESDNPMIVLDAPWSSSAARAGARQFTNFALRPAAQAKVAAAGFRLGAQARVAAVRADLVVPTNGVDATARTSAVAPASPAAIEQALAHWQTTRRRARVLFLFDVSDSMGDVAKLDGPTRRDGPTKISLAQAALAGALDQLAPDDDFGLRIFTTKLSNPVSPNWRDVVPLGPLAARRRALLRAIPSLTPEQGSPLYAATRDAFDGVARRADPQRINAVVLLTDGYNEDEQDNSQTALLAHLATNPNIPVFTIAYGNDADLATLRKIAQATDAWNFDARDTSDLAEVLPRALSSF
ncbi:MAG: substrate-binding and VWA domain-containing protein [Actinomycetota bacterium]|nr:substrate-binding and VWA domain-containing protein [Actinomycetota bacterium]